MTSGWSHFPYRRRYSAPVIPRVNPQGVRLAALGDLRCPGRFSGGVGNESDPIYEEHIMRAITTPTSPYHPDDIVVWPDGAWATVDEVRNGEYGYRSDDFEIVRQDDAERLKVLGLGDDFGLP